MRQSIRSELNKNLLCLVCVFFCLLLREEVCQYLDALLVLNQCPAARGHNGGSANLPGGHREKRGEAREQEAAHGQLRVSPQILGHYKYIVC